MRLESQPKTDVDSIFLNIEDAIQFIKLKGWLTEVIPCINRLCEGDMKVLKNKKYLNEYSYKCRLCGKEKNIFSGLRINNPSIKLGSGP